MVKVVIDGEEKMYSFGTEYLAIADEYQCTRKNQIVLVLINGKLEELFKTLKKDCKLEFITIADKTGNNTYRRSLIFLFLKALYDVEDEKSVGKAELLCVIGNGYYCELSKMNEVSQELVDKIKKRMNELVKLNIDISKKTVNLDDAITKFHDNGMEDKAILFKYRRVSKVNIYNIKDYEDYFYGYMLPSTGYIKYFDIKLYNKGMVLLFPLPNNPMEIGEFEPPAKLFNILQNNIEMGKSIGIRTVGNLNDKICDGSINNLILVQEAWQEKQIADIAAQIVERPDKKFIMIAGPTSSGKTTFSNRLAIQLLAQGKKPHPIALDNYFVNREDTPLDTDGKYNFECLEAIDTKQFNKDMLALLRGEVVDLPVFNFKLGQREYKGDYKKLGKDDILVIEGIHGLNDKLSYSLPKESKFKIYISALTQLNIDEHNRISANSGRLIRRIVRDSRTRGTKAKDTIAMWDSVRRGEEQYIFPFQEEADVMFNSALIYELSILKQYVEPQLFAIAKDEPEFLEAKRLLKFLDYFLPLPGEDIAKNSILREFIGGSCFNV